MTTLLPLFKTRPATVLMCLAGAAALGACGGGAATPATGAVLSTATFASQPPLIDDEGNTMPNAAGTEPADPGARTRSGRYASAAQARHLLEALGTDAIRAEVDCCDASAADEAEGVVAALRAAHSLGPDAPVLVVGQDLRLAAAVANRLGDTGHTRVWLVTR